MSRRRCTSGPTSRYWTLAVPAFALACVAGAPFIGALSIAVFWLIPALLRTRPSSPQQAVASSEPVSLTKSAGTQMPIG